MLATFRWIARPLSVIALLALLAPSWAECRPLAGAARQNGMSCCMKTDAPQGQIDSGCCRVDQTKESPQVPGTAVTGRTAPLSIDAPAAAPLAATMVIAPARHTSAIDTEPPGPPLYLRLSVIRR
jgi:hypothetical protein